MKYTLNYEAFQVAVETVMGVEDVITEIRFHHCSRVPGIDEVALRKLYVIHIPQDRLITKDKLTKDLVAKLVVEILGQEQVDHMNNIIQQETEDLFKEKAAKQYITLEI